MTRLLVVTLVLLGLGCGGAGTAPPAATPAATAPAARPIEAAEMPVPGEQPDGWMAGGVVGVPQSAPVLTGPMTKDQIRQVMQANQPRVRYCYERELLRNPHLAGLVVVKLVIRADGRVASAVVAHSTLHDAAVEQCIAAAVANLVFPPPLGGGVVVVNYPFKLQTAD